MLKKFGAVSVGVTAALLAAAPLASAHEGGHEGHHGNGHHASSNDNVGNTKCAAKSGDTKDNRTEGLLAGVGPVLNGNAGQIASCNSILNDNFSGNDVHVANHLLEL